MHIFSDISNLCGLRELNAGLYTQRILRNTLESCFTQLAMNHKHVICENSETAEAEVWAQRSSGVHRGWEISKCTY